jgi:PilY1 beta-propeller domain
MNITMQRAVRIAVVAGVLCPWPAYAQLDPLVFLKNTQPNIILAVDTANRMQRDADNTYYDPGTYAETNDDYEAVLGLASAEAAKTYRRKFFNLAHENPGSGSDEKFSASTIAAVGDLEPGYGTFFARTRLAIARRSLMQAITDNSLSARFALIRTRQSNPTLPAAGNEGPVRVSDPAQQTPTDYASGRWKITRTTVGGSNSTHNNSGLLTGADAINQNATILTTLGKSFGTAGALLPAGTDTKDVVDAPVGLLLEDARAHASALIKADESVGGCRNTIVVLVVGGGEGTISSQDLASKAHTFLNVQGRRVPIYVVALFPAASEVSELKAIAEKSGGQYFEVTKEMVAATTAGDPTPEVMRGVNTAVQHAFVDATTFNTAPTAALPFGPYAESQTSSPIVGTVNLHGASKLTSTGTESLPDSETVLYNGTVEVPQRSNVLITSGFQLPGFEGKLRAFRVYKPVADTTKPSGYRFVQDGSRLWVSSTPDAGSRNIFTLLPGSTSLMPFTAANATAIDDYLHVTDPEALIEFVRAMPMGAVIDSTPAFLDPPSLDPPPDADYPGFREENKYRRALVFVGGNDGMLHAIDARTGLEVWAFIPFNMLPKLRALRSGQPFDAFKYFVDSSPKISDVKIDDEWRTYLFFGQGPGGTFYNALDVTLENIADSVAQDSSSTGALLGYFASAEAITWKWSFPRNTSFDTSISTTAAPYGELAPGASHAEKTVGETWSDPAIGQVQNEDGVFVMLVGSGFLKHSVQSAHRGGVPRAGTTFYLLDLTNGTVMASKDVGADSFAETVDNCRVANDCRRIKNALQMDPVATGPQDQRFVTNAYIGDLDGKVWKFALGMSSGSATLSAPTKLYDAGAEYPLFASMAAVTVGTKQYLFVGTGSDLLPSPDAAAKSQTSSLLVLLDSGSSAAKTAEILLETIDGAAGDEKVTAFPAVAGDIVFFTTTTYNPTTPCTPFSANLYAFTFIGGPAYDTNNDGKLSTSSSGGSGGKGKKGGDTTTTGDSQKVFTKAGLRATAPFVVDQHLVFSAGTNVELFGDPEDFNNGVGQAGVRILSWRTVR